jgi:GT2 family glycosyltransferase
MNSTPDTAWQSISILIPTLGRTEPLWNTLRKLIPQLGPGDEILVLDQNHPPLTWPKDCTHPALRHHLLPQPGLTRARNYALKAARNNWVVFLDDDIDPDDSLIAEARKGAMQKTPAVYAGKVRQEQGPLLFGNANPSPMSPVGEFNPATGMIITDFRHTPEGPLPFFPGGCCLLPKDLLPRRGAIYCPYFLGAALGEEIDLSLRLRKQGMLILGLPNMAFDHLQAPMGGCRTEVYQTRFARHHVFNSALLFARHGNILNPIPFLRRLAGFVEFHSRSPKPSHKTAKKSRRNFSQLLILLICIPLGWGFGLAWKFQNRWHDRN